MACSVRNLLWGVLLSAVVFAGAGALLLAAPQTATNPPAEPPALAKLRAAVNEKLDVRASTLQELAFNPAADGQVTTAVNVDGVDMVLELQPYSLRSPDFQILAQVEEGGPLVPREIPPAHTFKGHVQGRPEIKVRASFDGQSMKAMIFTADGPHAIDPVADLGLTAAPALHAVYNSRDWRNTQGLSCGVEGQGPLGLAAATPHAAGAQRSAAGTLDLQIVEIGIDSDSFFYFDEGGNDAAVIDEIEAVVNTVEGIYEEDNVGITYEVTTTILRTVPGPYANPGDIGNLLCTFRSEWNSAPENNIRRDVAQLFSGQSLSGGIIGVAWLGTVCNGSLNVCGGGGNAGYSVVENISPSSSQAALNAHELGHNWSAGHCDGGSQCRIMCSVLGSCDGLSPLSFGPSEASVISGFKDNASCLHELHNPPPMPFCEEFNASSLDQNQANWSYINGASISTAATNPPTAPFVLRLNAAGSADYQDDDIRTNFINLSGQFNVQLTYFTQHVGVGAGEELVVEFWHNSDFWQELNRITSNGVDQTQFEFHAQVLPFVSAHNEFRLRFRSEVNSSADNWYIDNIGLNCFCADPCTDGNPCTLSDACDDILCTGTAVNCAPFDEECNAAACDQFGAEGNCAILNPANEGGVCGGGTGLCSNGTCMSLANTARVFMAGDGEQGSVALVGPTTMSMGSGTTAKVGVFINDDSAPGVVLNAYQLLIKSTATPLAGATGSVTYHDVNPGQSGGNSIFLDLARADWVFADEPVDFEPNYNETPGLGIFGLFYSTIPGTGQDPAALNGIRYLADFDLITSPGALGQFRLDFNVSQAPLTTLFQPSGAPFGVEQIQPLLVQVVPQGTDCTLIADCADTNNNGIRDDNCVWWNCFVGSCQATDIVFADMGGQFGNCTPDGTADGNDRFHALNCFSDLNTAAQPGYPCEDAPPQAFNVDAGGQFGNCAPDGVCDGNDAFHAVNAFSNLSACSCPLGGPAPQIEPVTVGRTSVVLRPRRGAVKPGGTIAVDVYLGEGVKDLRGYQLHLGASGGDQGRLELVDISVEERRDQAFAGQGGWQAFNVRTSQMVAGLDQPGIPAPAGAYLATFIYAVSEDAAGAFRTSLLHGDDSSWRTFLFATPANGKIEIASSTDAVIEVAAPPAKRGRASADRAPLRP